MLSMRAVRFVVMALLTTMVVMGGMGGTIGCRLLPAASATTLTVLAGSELQDIEPLLPQILKHTGIMLKFEYTGTLDGVEQLLGGKQVDLAWFSHAKYLTLLQGEKRIVKSQASIMHSPVVLGVRESKAREWGWLGNTEVTWKDIAQKVATGELRYAMTNPVASNSGFTALVGVASAFSGSSDALQVEGIDHEALGRFFRGQTLTSGSSGWLAERYVLEQASLQGMINYESILLQLNEQGKLDEPLYLVYPKEGIITADYPLMLINEERRDAYTRLVDYLRTPEVQQQLMEHTARRPAVPGIPLSPRFPSQMLVELPFPNRVEVLDTLLFSYLDKQRTPPHAIFVLDASGSMQGARIRHLKQAFYGLTGHDRSITGRFSRFREREDVTIIVFDGEVRSVTHFHVQNTDPNGPDMQAIWKHIESIEAVGSTAIFSALREAYRHASEARATQPERYTSIVLMSDGENTDGISYHELIDYYHSLPPTIQQIKTFPIVFGEANPKTMQLLAEQTGGKVFDATSTALEAIFKEIRGYQ